MKTSFFHPSINYLNLSWINQNKMKYNMLYNIFLYPQIFEVELIWRKILYAKNNTKWNQSWFNCQTHNSTKVGFDTKMTLVHPPPTYNLPTRNSLSAISQMLLIKFWPNVTIYNCQNDMCPCNICSDYTCPTSLNTKVSYPILTKIEG